MTDKKKPAPSMKAAAATQKLTKTQLEELLKNAQGTAEGEAGEDADDSDDDTPPPPPKKH
jgi:hypothetical protein